MSDKIGILGGTFDPIHEGHLTLARCAKEQFRLDKVLFVPAFIPPHKAARRDLTPAPYRYRMVEIAISKEPGFEVSQAEFNRPDISYTVETLRALKKEYPKTQFFLIIGDDTLAEIPRWREPEEIRRLAQILAAPREGGRIQTPSEKGITRIEMPVCPFSSSEIREKISQGKPVTEMLPPGVENYIRKMKLYPKSPSKA